jgi:hypothetical protein
MSLIWWGRLGRKDHNHKPMGLFMTHSSFFLLLSAHISDMGLHDWLKNICCCSCLKVAATRKENNINSEVTWYRFMERYTVCMFVNPELQTASDVDWAVAGRRCRLTDWLTDWLNPRAIQMNTDESEMIDPWIGPSSTLLCRPAGRRLPFILLLAPPPSIWSIDDRSSAS